VLRNERICDSRTKRIDAFEPCGHKNSQGRDGDARRGKSGQKKSLEVALLKSRSEVQDRMRDARLPSSGAHRAIWIYGECLAEDERLGAEICLLHGEKHGSEPVCEGG